MITISDVKAVYSLGQGVTADDVLIQDKIDFAYAFISDKLSGLIPDSNDDFIEYCDIIHREFYLKLKMNDISISEIKGYDSDDTEYTIPNSDCFKRSSRLYRENYTSANIHRVKVTYSSDIGKKIIDEIARDITIFEVKRQPIKTGSINKTGEGAGGIAINFVTSKDFYEDIGRRLEGIVLRGM